MKKIWLTVLTANIFMQVGCFKGETCWDNHLGEKGTLITTTYNGADIGKFETIMIDLAYNNMLLVEGKSAVEVKDGVVLRVRNIVYTVAGTMEGVISSFIPESPVKVDDIKTFPIHVKFNANQYRIANRITGKSAYLPPTVLSSGYFGWMDATTIQLYLWQNLSDQSGAIPLDQPVNMQNVHVADADAMTLDYGSQMTIRPEMITHFPDTSPNSDFETDFVTGEQIWNGTTTIKVLRNTDSIFQVLITIVLSDGVNTLVQNMDKTLEVTPDGCAANDPF